MTKEDSTRWTVLGLGTKPHFLLCRCECGTEREVNEYNIRYNFSRSCGCMRGDSLRQHGLSGSPEHVTWHGMIARCTNKDHSGYEFYGAKGIKVCSRWLVSFEAFYVDMAPKPSPKHSLDRIDNDGGYWCGKPDCDECGPLKREPNCKWSTAAAQRRNRKDNLNITYNGRTMCATDWAKEYGIGPSLFRYRIHAGWSFEEAVSKPDKGRKRHKKE